MKQEDEEAPCSSLSQHVKTENVQYNCQKQENFVDVSIEMGSTNIKQELEEEDPLGLENLSKGRPARNSEKGSVRSCRRAMR